MDVAILVYDGITGAEAIGPYEVFRRAPGVSVSFVAQRPGPHTAHGRPGVLVADRSLAEVPHPDVVVVPGGFGTRQMLRDESLLNWLAEAHRLSQWTTAVSTGSLLLGAAGVLEGQPATTMWLVLDELADFGAIPVADRVVAQGRVVTASGPAGGVELADLVVRRTYGGDVAAAIQRSMRADVHRPFGTRPSPLTAARRPALLRTSVPVAAGPYVVVEEEPRRRWSRRRP